MGGLACPDSVDFPDHRLYFKIPSLDSVRPENFVVKYKGGSIHLSVLWPLSLKKEIIIGPLKDSLDLQSMNLTRKGEQVVVGMAKMKRGKWENLTKREGEYSTIKNELSGNRSATPGKAKEEEIVVGSSSKKPKVTLLKLSSNLRENREVEAEAEERSRGRNEGKGEIKRLGLAVDVGREGRSRNSPLSQMASLKGDTPRSSNYRRNQGKELPALRLSKTIRDINDRERVISKANEVPSQQIARKSLEEQFPIRKTEVKTDKKVNSRLASDNKHSDLKQNIQRKTLSSSPLHARSVQNTLKTPHKTPDHPKNSLSDLKSTPKATRFVDSKVKQNQNPDVQILKTSKPVPRKSPNQETSTDQSSEKDWMSKLGGLFNNSTLTSLEGYYSMETHKKLPLQKEMILMLSSLLKEELSKRYECEKRFEKILLGDSRKITELERKLDSRKTK